MLYSIIITYFISIKTYIYASMILLKPTAIYLGMRFLWLSCIAGIEWWSARLYSINCIGEGFSGFYNHLWSIASPSCTGLLTTHIGLMGVLVASFIITFVWGILKIINNIKELDIPKKVINEFNELKKLGKLKI